MAADPIAKFRRWFEEARRAGAPLPEAMALATADARGRPSARFVLLKQADARGFVFYTHQQSRKGRELSENPYAALVVYWDKTNKQVRVEGRVEEVSAAQADAYWATRPRPSQLGAWASAQSAPLDSRAALLARVAKLFLQYAGKPIPRPAHWTGYRVLPQTMEFWVRGEHRLHVRELFTRSRSGWKRALLQP